MIHFRSVGSTIIKECWKSYDIISEGMKWVISYAMFLITVEGRNNKKFLKESDFMKTLPDMLTCQEIIPVSLAQKFLFYSDVSIVLDIANIPQTKEKLTLIQQTSKQDVCQPNIAQRKDNIQRIANSAPIFDN